MPRRFFKSFSRQRHRWKERWFMRPFRLLLEHPVYWTLNRRSVTRALALGLLISFVPIPVHFLIATLLALLLRVNVPAALLGTLLTNPFTVVPMYMAAYWVGCALLDIPPGHFSFELSWEWLTTALLPIWKPFLLGCLVLGVTAAVSGYVLLATVWHLTLVFKYHERKGGSNARGSLKSEK